MKRKPDLSMEKRRLILQAAADNPRLAVTTSNVIDPATLDTALYGHHKSASPSPGKRVWVFDNVSHRNAFHRKYIEHVL